MCRLASIFLFGLAMLLLALLGACASEPRIDEAVPGPATVVLLPLENRSGVDLPRQPGLVWRSSEIMKLLLEMEVSEAPLAEWPFAEVEPGELPPEVAADSALREQLTYAPDEGVLRFKETMLYEERDRLRTLSPEPSWREAIDRLYAHSMRDRKDVLAAIRRAIAARLTRLGYEVHTLQRDELPDTLSHPERLKAAREQTGAEHALLVAIERWQASELFETGTLHVEASAALVDSRSRELQWGHHTGPLQLQVHDAEAQVGASHAVIDMRSAYSRLAIIVAEQLLPAGR